jgi:CRISPR-associated RAMP protein (TIGR02581 family)
MFDRFNNRLILSGTLTAKTALRIGAGRATELTGTDLPFVRDSFGNPYIPGSSFKGVLRAGTEAIIRSIAPHRKGACIPISEAEQCVIKGAPRSVEAKEKNQEWKYPRGGASPSEKIGIGDLEAGLPDDPTRRDAEFTSRVKAESCLACQIFGSPWLAAKVNVRDLLVDNSLWAGQFEQRNGVAIDRDTETAADKKLYDFEVVPAGTRFRCEIVVENAEDWELGLLMLGLRQFERGEAALGGARSRGLGVVEVTWDSRKRIKDADSLLSYILDENGVPEITADELKDWITKLRERLNALAIQQEEGQSNA